MATEIEKDWNEFYLPKDKSSLALKVDGMIEIKGMAYTITSVRKSTDGYVIVEAWTEVL